MSYNLIQAPSSSEVYLNNTANGSVEMTQVNPIEPVTPAEVIEPVQPAPVAPVVAPAIDLSELAQISIHQAARDGRADVIDQRLFKIGRSSNRRFKIINKLDENKVSPLHYAVRYGHNHVVKMLVDYGADINIQGEDGATPLHYAARLRASKLKQGYSRMGSRVDGDTASTDTIGESIQAALIAAASSETLSISKANLSIDPDDESIIDYLISNYADVNARDSYGLTPLHYAANKGNIVSTVELLRSKDILVDERDTSGGTSLHAAANEGATEVVEALIKAGADIRAKDFENSTPLHFACTEGHTETGKVLLDAADQKGGDVEVEAMLSDKNREKELALHSAVDGGHYNLVSLCIQKGANVKAARSNNTQPLHLAAVSGNVKIGKLLLDEGANIEARDANHETPLHRAAGFNRINFVEYLIAKGANIECRDKDNFTPLLTASSSGFTGVIKSLLGRGANLKAKDIHDRTAIYMAAESNCIETLKELLEASPGKSLINEGNFYEDTPLHIAAKKGFVIVTELLLDNGAKIDARNEEEDTALHLAAKHGRTRTVLALLKRDSDIINDEDEYSNTPLHLAATEGHTKCVRELLESGAAVDARNSNLWTPLDCAAAGGYVKCADVLLEYDSPVDPTDRTRTTPLHLASRMGHVDMVQLLLKRNADIALTDHTGRNCLDMAVDHGQKEVAMVIINDPNWSDAMKNKTLEQGNVTTPMRKLIDRLPDVAEAVLNKCVFDNNLPLHHPDYKIFLNYEYLEDLYSDWLTSSGSSMTGSDSGSVQSLVIDARSEYGYQMIDDENIGEVTKQLEKKNSHPLMIMVKRKREKLLSHPLVTFLLNYKWRNYGRYVYYIKLLVYCILLFFLTGYSVTSSQNRPKKVNGTCIYSTAAKDKTEYKIFVTLGSIVIIILACWHILMELFQLSFQVLAYFGWENLLEWTVYVSAIAYVAPEIDGAATIGFGGCESWHMTVGAISIWCGWMSLLLFIRKFPKLGIYVVMFTDILQTFLMFSFIFILFIVAFALAFFTLFSEKEQFNSAGRSLVKTGVMMIGEFEFDSIFGNDEPAIAWVLFIVFLVVMTLILMNLLIGLAVDDIKGVQDQAVLQRQAMLVDLALDVEKAMPRRIRRNFAITRGQSFYPNRHQGMFWFLRSPIIKPQDMKDALDTDKSPIQRIEEQNDTMVTSMKSMRMRMKELQEQQEQLQSMLKAVVKKLDAVVDDDAEEEESLDIGALFKQH